MAENQYPLPDPATLAAITSAVAAQSPTVSYPLADLLDRMGSRLDQGFSRIEALMANKADKADVARVEARLDEHGKDIGSLKAWRSEASAVEKADAQEKAKRLSFAQWRMGAMISFGGLISSMAVLVYYLVH